MGTQILDLDFIGIKSSLRDAWGLLDFLQDDHEVLDVAVQEIEGFIDWKSHGRWILSAAVVACIRSVRDGWQANRTRDMRTAQYPLPAKEWRSTDVAGEWERVEEWTDLRPRRSEKHRVSGCGRGAETITSMAAIVAS